MKKFVMLLAAALVFVLAMPMYAAPVEEPAQIRAQAEYDAEDISGHILVVDGTMYIGLRFAAEFMGADVVWDAENYVVIITNALGETSLIVLDDVGGFIEEDRAWVPIDFANNELLQMAFVQIEAERVERIGLTIWNQENFAEVREASFSTDLPHGEIAVNFIRHMSGNLGLRTPFTYKELETAIWIVEELLAMGHDWGSIEIQEFTYWDIREAELGLMPLMWETVTSPWMLGTDRDEQIRADRVSQNVVLTLPGESERKIIVGAHYDSVPYPGASDNASGTALLLESAQRMLGLDHYFTIVYVFFGAEEVGLLGAYYFYHLLTPEERGNIVMMINADVLIEGPYIIYGAGGLPEITDEVIYKAMASFTDMFLETLEAHLELAMEDFAAVGIDVDELPEDFFDDMLQANLAWLANLNEHLFIMQAYMVGLIEPNICAYALHVSEIAQALSYENDFDFISLPSAIGFSSDNLVFLFEGYTIVNFVGLERIENLDGESVFMPLGDFSPTVIHSPRDEFYYIEARWPGMMLANLRAFGLLLEGILTSGFYGGLE